MGRYSLSGVKSRLGDPVPLCTKSSRNSILIVDSSNYSKSISFSFSGKLALDAFEKMVAASISMNSGFNLWSRMRTFSWSPYIEQTILLISSKSATVKF